MDLDEYQQKTGTTRLDSYNAEACVMGLLSEAGEIAGVFQKLIRGDYSLQEAAARLEKELGDVLWHVAEIAKDNNWKLSDIAKVNLDKLESRQLRKVLLGHGDNR